MSDMLFEGIGNILGSIGDTFGTSGGGRPDKSAGASQQKIKGLQRDIQSQSLVAGQNQGHAQNQINLKQGNGADPSHEVAEMEKEIGSKLTNYGGLLKSTMAPHVPKQKPIADSRIFADAQNNGFKGLEYVKRQHLTREAVADTQESRYLGFSLLGKRIFKGFRSIFGGKIFGLWKRHDANKAEVIEKGGKVFVRLPKVKGVGDEARLEIPLEKFDRNAAEKEFSDLTSQEKELITDKAEVLFYGLGMGDGISMFADKAAVHFFPEQGEMNAISQTAIASMYAFCALQDMVQYNSSAAAVKEGQALQEIVKKLKAIKKDVPDIKEHIAKADHRIEEYKTALAKVELELEAPPPGGEEELEKQKASLKSAIGKTQQYRDVLGDFVSNIENADITDAFAKGLIDNFTPEKKSALIGVISDFGIIGSSLGYTYGHPVVGAAILHSGLAAGIGATAVMAGSVLGGLGMEYYMYNLVKGNVKGAHRQRLKANIAAEKLATTHSREAVKDEKLSSKERARLSLERKMVRAMKEGQVWKMKAFKAAIWMLGMGSLGLATIAMFCAMAALTAPFWLPTAAFGVGVTAASTAVLCGLALIVRRGIRSSQAEKLADVAFNGNVQSERGQEMKAREMHKLKNSMAAKCAALDLTRSEDNRSSAFEIAYKRFEESGNMYGEITVANRLRRLGLTEEEIQKTFEQIRNTPLRTGSDAPSPELQRMTTFHELLQKSALVAAKKRRAFSEDYRDYRRAPAGARSMSLETRMRQDGSEGALAQHFKKTVQLTDEVFDDIFVDISIQTDGVPGVPMSVEDLIEKRAELNARKRAFDKLVVRDPVIGADALASQIKEFSREELAIAIKATREPEATKEMLNQASDDLEQARRDNAARPSDRTKESLEAAKRKIADLEARKRVNEAPPNSLLKSDVVQFIMDMGASEQNLLDVYDSQDFRTQNMALGMLREAVT